MADRHRQVRLDQWQVLRHLLGEDLAASELARLLGRRVDSVTRSLRTLEDGELVEGPAEETHSAPGRPRGWWSLTDLGREEAERGPPAVSTTRDGESADEAELGAGLGQGTLERHQTYLAARVESGDVPALLRVLSVGGRAAEASIVARLDGEGHRYLFLFDSRLGARPVEMLSATLEAAGIDFTAGTVADVRTVQSFVADALAAQAAASSPTVKPP